MQEAFDVIFEIYFKFIKFIFDDAEIFSGVTIGWIFAAVAVFGVIIGSILAVPKASQTYTFRKGGDEE